MIDQCKITDKLNFRPEVVASKELRLQTMMENRQLRWSCDSGSIALQIIYPLQLKYGFINQVLHHLVATINKSALLSFLVKVDFQSNSPLFLTFYHTILLPLVEMEDQQAKTPEISKLFALPDLIYRKIVLICESFTIRQSQLAKAYELIQQITHLSQQIAQFIKEVQQISTNLKTKQQNRMQALNFQGQAMSLCSQSHSF